MIQAPIETHVIDGIEMVFQLAPETEAPAEMHMFYPALRALNLAENATHNLHNVYPLRGAQVRDANAWAKYLNEAMDRFGREADVAFAQHHWPVWGTARVLDFLGKQRDLYKFLHDQTVRLMNHGYAASDIGERLRLPKSLASTWHVRGYYGTLSHNARSVYQRYLGWYDAHPAHLDPLPPVARARKYVEYMGGADAVVARAQADFARGEYRFVAEAMRHVVFADPTHVAARRLGADALEQLGYAAESATWRNAYLLGAARAPAGPAARPGAHAGQPERRARDEPRAALRLHGRAHRRRPGRRHAARAELRALGSGADVRADARPLRPDVPRRAAERRRRRHPQSRPRHARRASCCGRRRSPMRSQKAAPASTATRRGWPRCSICWTTSR